MIPSTVCQRCGYQNLQQARFCQSCGTPLPVQPSQPFTQTSPHYYAPPRSGMGSGTIVLIIAIVLIVVLVVAVAAAVFVFYTPALISRVSPRTGPVAVTGLFLEIFYPNSSYNGYFGNSLRPIGYAIPIYLQHNQIYQTQFTLTLAPGRNRTIDQISLASSDGFSIQSYSPNLPVTMTPGSSTIFTVTLQAPSTDYMGPVTIDLYTY